MNNNKELIRVLVVDDESAAREKLIRYVEALPQFLVIGSAKNGQEAIEKITELNPQVLLLDIQMPGMSGFDVLRLIDNTNIAVVFTTAYDEYAVQAFDVSAVDYLLKPISESRFNQALEKVANRLKDNWDEKIASVLQNIREKKFIHRLATRKGKQTLLVNVSDIEFIRSENRLVHVYDKQGVSSWTNETLSQLMNRLNPSEFMQVHRSAIVRLDAQYTIEKMDSGRLKLYFNNEHEIVVSRENSDAFKRFLV